MTYQEHVQMVDDLGQNIRLRPARVEDAAIVYQIKKSALQQYVDEIWGWDESWQRKFHEEHFQSDGMEIVEIDGHPAGYLVVREFLGHLLLESLHFISDFQRRGVGTRLIQDVLRYGRETGRIVRLKVLRVNPARRLYKRLGFEDVAETDTHFIMECR